MTTTRKHFEFQLLTSSSHGRRGLALISTALVLITVALIVSFWSRPQLLAIFVALALSSTVLGVVGGSAFVKKLGDRVRSGASNADDELGPNAENHSETEMVIQLEPPTAELHVRPESPATSRAEGRS